MIKNQQLLVNAQVDINRAVFEANCHQKKSDREPRLDYIMGCVDSAIETLKEYKKKNRAK